MIKTILIASTCFCVTLCLEIHFLNIHSRGRRTSRWNRKIAAENPGGVEPAALYGGENTCQVNETNILFRKPHFMDFAINVLHVLKQS